MNRFTVRDKNGIAHCVKDGSPECLGVCGECEFDNNFIDALAAYEDTMITPEDINLLVGEFIALTSLDYGKQRFFQQENCTWYDRDKCDYITTATMILRAYETLEPYVRI